MMHGSPACRTNIQQRSRVQFLVPTRSAGARGWTESALGIMWYLEKTQNTPFQLQIRKHLPKLIAFGHGHAVTAS
jgi:hypothetical protein